MAKIVNDYKILSLNVLVRADRKDTDVEEAIADALGIKIGAQPLKELEEFISIQACSYYYTKQDLLERVIQDYRTGEIRAEMSVI